MVTAVGLAEVNQAGLDAEDQVVEGLRAGNQVEGGRQGAALVKIGEPQLGSGELPLHVGILLHTHTEGVSGISQVNGLQKPFRTINLLLLLLLGLLGRNDQFSLMFYFKSRQLSPNNKSFFRTNSAKINILSHLTDFNEIVHVNDCKF